MELIEELEQRNDQLKQAVADNNGHLSRFEMIKPMISQQQELNQSLKAQLKSGRSDHLQNLWAEKTKLVMEIQKIKQQIRELQFSIDNPPHIACEQLEEDNDIFKNRLQKLHTAYYPNLQIPRKEQTPEQRFELCYAKMHKRTDSTLVDPIKLGMFIKETSEHYSCLSEIYSQVQMLTTNTVRNPTFLMAFGVLPEIARAHNANYSIIINYFSSKWCARLEKTLLGWLDNLPEIEVLEEKPRASDKRWFAADDRAFGCGKIANFLLTALILQGWEAVADAGGIGVKQGENVIYV